MLNDAGGDDLLPARLMISQKECIAEAFFVVKFIDDKHKPEGGDNLMSTHSSTGAEDFFVMAGYCTVP